MGEFNTELQKIQDVTKDSLFSLQSNTDGLSDLDAFGSNNAFQLNRLLDQDSLEIAQGNVPGKRLIRIVGFDDNVTTTKKDIGNTGVFHTWLQSADSVQAISTNVNDTSGGSGARVITVFGLDDDFLEVQEDITMNGTTLTSSTTQTFRRINDIVVKETGTYASSNSGSNAGDITLSTTTGSFELAHILDGIGTGRDGFARYTIPAGKTGFIKRISLSVDGKKSTNVFSFSRGNADVVSAPFSPKFLRGRFIGISASLELDLNGEEAILPEMTDFWFCANVDSAPVGSISLSASIILIDNV